MTVSMIMFNIITTEKISDEFMAVKHIAPKSYSLFSLGKFGIPPQKVFFHQSPQTIKIKFPDLGPIIY